MNFAASATATETPENETMYATAVAGGARRERYTLLESLGFTSGDTKTQTQ